MNNSIKGLLAAALLVTLTACTGGQIENKRAPGMPGEKRYEIMVDGRWMEVTVLDWQRCNMTEYYPSCLNDPARYPNL